MGVQIGLQGQGNYARTVESVSQQPADRAGAPSYQAIRDYVFSGSARGELRVKYGNHNRQLELGTKGLFATGERHELTGRVLRQVVEQRYGHRAANQFFVLISNANTQRAVIYHLDKNTVRRALETIERDFGVQELAPLHPEVLKIPNDSAEQTRAEIASSWAAAVSTKSANDEPFPPQVLRDMDRYHLTLQDGRAVWRQGRTGEHDRDRYLAEEKEKWLTFFEQGSGLQRDHADFPNMFRNFIRNLQQNFELSLNSKLLDHCQKVGYRIDQFAPDGNRGEAEQNISFENGELVFDRQSSMPLTLLRENIDLKATLTERFRIPVERLKEPEAQFDIATAVVEPSRSYSIARER